MARERNSQGLGAVLPGSMRWALVGYGLPAILIGMLLLIIRSGPVTAQPYNYGLLLLVVVLLSATIAVTCLAVAVVLSVQALRREPIAAKWPHYAVLFAELVTIVVTAVWLAQI